jgi:hypothetical protein
LILGGGEDIAQFGFQGVHAPVFIAGGFCTPPTKVQATSRGTLAREIGGEFRLREFTIIACDDCHRDG